MINLFFFRYQTPNGISLLNRLEVGGCKEFQRQETRQSDVESDHYATVLHATTETCLISQIYLGSWILSLFQASHVWQPRLASMKINCNLVGETGMTPTFYSSQLVYMGKNE
jgi:hypothetical protein